MKEQILDFLRPSLIFMTSLSLGFELLMLSLPRFSLFLHNNKPLRELCTDYEWMAYRYINWTGGLYTTLVIFGLFYNPLRPFCVIILILTLMPRQTVWMQTADTLICLICLASLLLLLARINPDSAPHFV